MGDRDWTEFLFENEHKVFDIGHSGGVRYRTIMTTTDNHVTSIEDGIILIVDDDQDILTAGKLLLKRRYRQIDTCDDPNQIPILLAETDYTAILLDMNFGPGKSNGEEGFYWLKKILQIEPDAVVVLITAHGGVDVAVEAMKIGATDFISKPWQNEKVVATLSASVKLSQTRSEAKKLRETNSALMEVAKTSDQPMLGDSPAMQAVQSMIARAAPTDANVLILGENGTGKELVARALHQQSYRRKNIFMSIDLGSITETIFESELFGHIKGAFTDASSDKIGRLQAANGGTLFLDEIGNLPLHLQAKLLSVLEQRQFSPVGSTKLMDIDIRVIAATNLPKSRLNDEHVFRQDLLFRLNTVEIELPPLRERRDDISMIAAHYTDDYCKKYSKAPKHYSAEAIDSITDYPWPGNIRALRHAIERAVILSDGDLLTPADFQLSDQQSANEGSRDALRESGELELNLIKLEKRAIEQALGQHRYNISHAAKELGLTRAALYRRMEKHGL
jgi:DNA-binding NtrC family response regulator